MTDVAGHKRKRVQDHHQLIDDQGTARVVRRVRRGHVWVIVLRAMSESKECKQTMCPFVDASNVACGRVVSAEPDPSRPSCDEHSCWVAGCSARVLRGRILCPQHTCKASQKLCDGLVVSNDGFCFACACSEYIWEGRSNAILDPVKLRAQLLDKLLLLKNMVTVEVESAFQVAGNSMPPGIVALICQYIAAPPRHCGSDTGTSLPTTALDVWDPDASGAPRCPFLIGLRPDGLELPCGLGWWSMSNPARPTCQSHACAVDGCGKRMVPWEEEATVREGGSFLPVCPDHKCQGGDCFDLIVSSPSTKLCAGCLVKIRHPRVELLDPVVLRQQLFKIEVELQQIQVGDDGSDDVPMAAK